MPHGTQGMSPRNLSMMFFAFHNEICSLRTSSAASSVRFVKCLEVYGIDSEGWSGKAPAVVRGAKISGARSAARKSVSL